MFWPLTIAQSHTRATAVLVDELDPSALERCADGLIAAIIPRLSLSPI
jgi:hypothetical protein